MRQFRRPFALTVLAAVIVPAVARAEGSAQVNVPNNQYAQAASTTSVSGVAFPTNGHRMGQLGLDILSAGERITWTGNGTLDVWAPGLDPSVAAPTVTLNSGANYTTTAAGEWLLEMNADQNGAWDITVTGAAANYGRLWSKGWLFYTGSFAQTAITNASFYALVPGGAPGRSGVLQLQLNGMSGNEYFIAANRRGVDGPDAGRSVRATGHSITPEYKVYLNPPEVSTFDPITPAISLLSFNGGDASCQQVERGQTPGAFRFQSNIDGTFHLVCDTNRDGVYDRVSRSDFSSVNVAVNGENVVEWDGTDDAGNVVPVGDYNCRVYLNTGEMHYVAWDVETAYHGLRLFEVTETAPDSGAFARGGLPMFWDDSDPALPAAVDLPLAGTQYPVETSGATGRSSGTYASAAAVCYQGAATCNARGWGNYNGGGNSEGNTSFLDTYSYLRTVASSVIQIHAGDPVFTDADTLSDYIESCWVGTDPTNPDTDGDGIWDDGEDDGTGIDTDGDGVIDALDADSDNDGVTDSVEGPLDTDGDGIVAVLDLDADGDGILDVVEAGLGALDADGDGRIDSTTDADVDGLMAPADENDLDDAVTTSTAPDPDTDEDGAPDRLDLDSDEDGIPDVTEAGGLDDGTGMLDGSGVDLDGDGIDDAVDVTEAGAALPLPDSDADGREDFRDVDSDGDGVTDEVEGLEDYDGDGIPNYLDLDSDGDGIPDVVEAGLGAADADGDGRLDDTTDADGDGLVSLVDADDTDPTVTTSTAADPNTDGLGGPDRLDLDADGDGLADVVEAGGTDDGSGHLAGGDQDADGDGLADAVDPTAGGSPLPLPDTDGAGGPDYVDLDSDGDGVTDVVEAGGTDDGSGHLAGGDQDADGDGLGDPVDPSTGGTALPVPDTDGTDGPDYRDVDADGDGVDDGADSNRLDPFRCGDDDDDSCEDCSGGHLDLDADGVDDDDDGVCSAGDPNDDDQDSDDDGVLDGAEPNRTTDSDGDGLINALDPDSDDDGLLDGTELGSDCSSPGTDRAVCVSDADPSTKTDPLRRDTDTGGVADGNEDPNLDGAIGVGEGDAADSTDDAALGPVDSDGDGLSDAMEAWLGSDPSDADTDDDGALDGLERNPSVDTDGDGKRNLVDPDSDDDGLLDGLEEGADCLAPDSAAPPCVADGDPGSRTSPLLADTDGGGVSDSNEDVDLDGALDVGETDPTLGHAADDGILVDSDDDGLSDALEAHLESDPNDADSDDDGVRDGDEPQPTVDLDGDTLINLIDPDSDGDGLLDGTELGTDCADADTGSPPCVIDQDPSTTTSMLDADTDRGGLADGIEDANHDGALDPDETDPNDPIDDIACASDEDCGAPDDEVVCDDERGRCVAGCRGTGTPAGCPADQTCSSADASLGACTPVATGAGGAGGAPPVTGGAAGAMPTGGAAGSAGAGPTGGATEVCGGAAGTPAAAGAGGSAAIGGAAGTPPTGGAAGMPSTGGAAGTPPTGGGAAGTPSAGGALSTGGTPGEGGRGDAGDTAAGGGSPPPTGGASGGRVVQDGVPRELELAGGGGCGCSTPRRAGGLSWLLVALPAAAVTRRRRRQR